MLAENGFDGRGFVVALARLAASALAVVALSVGLGSCGGSHASVDNTDNPEMAQPEYPAGPGGLADTTTPSIAEPRATASN